MDHVIAARAQMGTSLAFHIVFAALGVGLPLVVFIAEGLWLRTKRQAYYDLARAWAKGMAVLFTVGAVSGTILSFELGLLWPGFMRYAGSLIGVPFSFEGFAFFIEAIFIGLYLYGWDRLPPVTHWLCAVPVIISGALSASFVTLVNAWMNMPTGFRLDHGRIVDVDPFRAMFSPPWLLEVLHTTIAAYVITGFGVAAVCALALLRARPGASVEQLRDGLRIAMIVASVTAVLQFIVGDTIARFDASNEPWKFAAMEVVRHTQSHVPETLGGIVGPNETRYAIVIPDADSLLVGFSPNTIVQGLDSIAPQDRPPVGRVHYSFDTMVGSASILLLVAVLWAWFARRGQGTQRRLLQAIVVCGPLAIVALEAGWCTTEFGRQPWIAHGLLLVSAAATTAPGIEIQFFVFTFVYVVLATMCWWLLRRIRTHGSAAHEVISSPSTRVVLG